MRRSTAVVECPKSMVGRVIGKNGETIKALQSYSGALIQIDQTQEPTKVTISGTPHSLSLAVSMVSDIVKGTFKGFALLRQVTQPGGAARAPAPMPAFPPSPGGQPRPVYAPGYGLIPPSQLYGGEDRATAAIAAYGGNRGPSPTPQQQFNWAGGQVSPSQMILGLPPAGGRGVGGINLLNGQMQQLAVQQGYGMSSPYGGLAYYPQEYADGYPQQSSNNSLDNKAGLVMQHDIHRDMNGQVRPPWPGLQDHLLYQDPGLYQQMMFASSQQQAPTGDAALRMASARMMHMQGSGNGSGVGGGARGGQAGVPASKPGQDWLPGKEVSAGSNAVRELLGGGSGSGQAPDAAAAAAAAAAGGNLVMDQEGKVYYYSPVQDS